MTDSETIVAVDVGNSAIKVALADRSDIESIDQVSVDSPSVAYQTFSLDEPDRDQAICDWVAGQTAGESLSWWVSTVNRSASRPLQQSVLRTFGAPPRHDSSRQDSRLRSGDGVVSDSGETWRTIRYDDLPLLVSVDAPQRVGIDRLLGAYAASHRFPGSIVVVDVGSAVTVDLVRKIPGGDPEFVGGAIFPGIRLQHAALAAGTEGLEPSTAFERGDGNDVQAAQPGTNTEAAIRLGVLAAVAGGIDRLYQEYGRSEQSRMVGDGSPAQPSGTLETFPRLVLSGGDCEAISGFLLSDHDLVRSLVCEGLMELALEQCPNRA